MHFVELYHGEFSEERLIRALGNVHPMEIYRVGRDNPAKLPGWKKYVFPIYMQEIVKAQKNVELFFAEEKDSKQGEQIR